jgi:hypothetical protein
MSRKQPIPSENCVESHLVIEPDRDGQDTKRWSVLERLPPSPSPEVDLLTSEELTALRKLFELLSRWDESEKRGETKHE